MMTLVLLALLLGGIWSAHKAVEYDSPYLGLAAALLILICAGLALRVTP